MMQRDAVSPGFAVESEYAAEPASLSEMLTLPAVIVLLSLLVVCENAENAPLPATAPALPSTASDTRALRTVGVRVRLRSMITGAIGRNPFGLDAPLIPGPP